MSKKAFIYISQTVKNYLYKHTSEDVLVLAAAETPISDDTEVVVAVSTLAVVDDAYSIL